MASRAFFATVVGTMVSNAHVFALLSVVMSWQAHERLLDLSRRAERPGRETVTDVVSACAQGAAGEEKPVPPLRIVLKKLNSAEYSIGGILIADIAVSNIGPVSMRIPWMTRTEFGSGFEGRDALEASIGISATDANGRSHRLTGAILRGSPARPGSLQTLAAGETITIRIPGWITFDETANTALTGDIGRQAPLYASLIFVDGECRQSAPVQSEPVNVWFRRGKRP